MNRRPGKPTMADVAHRAGVSPSTVARALYANGYVAEQKRALIEAAIRDIGYRPNLMARGLRTARSHTIGLVVSEAGLNAFHPYVAHEVQIEAFKHGYTVLTLNNGASAAVEAAGVRRFLDQHVDAVIFCAAVDPDNVRLIHDAGIPAIQIEREIAEIGGKVLVDPRPGMSEAVQHLVALGHRRIAFIGGSTTIAQLAASKSVEAQRSAAFTEALEAAGHRADPALIKLGRYRASSGALQPGYVAMEELLALTSPPSAVIAGSDLLAAGALQAISAAGLSVPADLSIIGFDDTMADILTPPLTSIAQPIGDLGRGAVQMALRSLTGAAMETPEVYPTRLIHRASTGAPRRE